ncbi:callose synthase 7-like isoform X2 [Olea europaea subsp. europaea]|uniref:Callose synthase 7-like isoform X2 n=1 Tax=Olea europaea subsp. europaea TaxID=158383 RepID=A0A8S0TQN1_OLEEU|nr:callose synthase 7-like isoform X2 [Olea europaea subsp. europaea]
MQVRNKDIHDYDQLDSHIVQGLMDKILKNYQLWCNYLHCKQNLCSWGDKRQQSQLLYVGLYLLIWGEASNLWFMPECLCYIFHCGINQIPVGKSKPKTNFVEFRTYLHLYRSFDRMWIFIIVALQAMIIIAWHQCLSSGVLFDEDVLRTVLSIFITAAILNFLQATNNIGVVIAIWAPVTMIRTLGMLRSRFESVPRAFNKLLVPHSKEEMRQLEQDNTLERRNIAKFSQMWNEFILSLRTEDLISHRVILQICDKVEDSLKQQRFLSEFKMNGLPLLSDKLDKFLTLIVSENKDYENIDLRL